MKKSIYKIHTALAIVLLLAFSKQARAQYDAMFTQYMFNEMFINPAYAGSKEAMSATLLHRQQWVNFAGRPITTSFSLHGPLVGNKMGLGMSILNESIGSLNRTLFYGSYAYRLKVSENGKLAFGLMAGIENQSNKLSTVKVSDNGVSDPSFAGNTSLIAPNFGLGLYYTTKTFYAGISIPRMIDNQGKFSTGNIDGVTVTKFDASKFTYYITAGNVFKLNDDLKLKAMGMIKLVQNAPIQMDLGANLLIKDLIWAGLSYRTGSSMSVILGVQATKQFLVSYSFDYTLNKIQSYSAGSHEIVLNYLFSFKSKKIITPRYF